MKQPILGVDEAGRGPWAGPVFVAMVLGGEELNFARDSKSLTEKAREDTYDKVLISVDEVAVGQCSSQEIDELGLSAALRLASQRAFSQISKPYQNIIVDGKHNFTGIKEKRLKTQVKADASVAQVSAASIIAKVERDRWMKNFHVSNPHWNFAKNKGYGTKEHMQLINKYGLSEIHRRSFKPIKEYELNTSRSKS